MEKVHKIELGKIDFNKIGRKINAITIKVEIHKQMFYTYKKGDYWSGEYVFSVQGTIWNASRTDALVGGQCDYTLKKILGDTNPLFNRIYNAWQKYHLKLISSFNEKEYAEIMSLFDL